MDQSSRKSNTDNRRDFLRDSLMLAAVPATLAGAPVQATAPLIDATSPTIKLGVLGCGRRGLQLARTALASSVADVQLSCLADLFADRMQQLYRAINSNFAERVLLQPSDRHVGLRAAEQLANSDVQAVIVSAAPGFRVDHLRLLVEAGKHLYVERPLATSLSDTRQVARLAEQACQQGQAIHFGLQHRHQPFFRTLVEQLNQGAIGQPVLAQITLDRPLEQLPVPSKRESAADFRYRHWQFYAALGGHPLLEKLSGQLDLVNWIASATPESASVVTTGERLTKVRLAYSSGLTLDCQLRATVPGLGGEQLVGARSGAGLSLLIQGTSGWCDVMKGKIYNQANRLLWSAVGTPSDSQSAVDAWLANSQHSTNANAQHIEHRCASSLEQIQVAVEANLTALLGSLSVENNCLVTWKSLT